MFISRQPVLAEFNDFLANQNEEHSNGHQTCFLLVPNEGSKTEQMLHRVMMKKRTLHGRISMWGLTN